MQDKEEKSEEKVGLERPLEVLIRRQDEHIAALTSNIVKGNAFGIAACLAASFKGVPVGFPLAMFLLGALGYGLTQLGKIIETYDVTAYYVRLGKKALKEQGSKWTDLIDDPSPKGRDRAGRWAFWLDAGGSILAISAFLLGVISGFIIIAF